MSFTEYQSSKLAGVGKLFAIFFLSWLTFCQKPPVKDIQRLEKKKGRKGLILCLHDIDGGGRYSLRRRQLKQLFDIIKTSYQVVSVNDFVYGDLEPDRKIIVLTFDDGFQSVFSRAVPLLQQYKFGATFFIYLKRHVDNSPFYSKLGQLNSSFEVGGHSFSHSDLAALYRSKPEKVYKEIFLSKKKLEYLIKKSVKSFAWPYGSFEDRMSDMPEKAGYQIQVSTEYRIARSEERILPRFTLTQPDPVNQLKKLMLLYEKAL